MKKRCEYVIIHNIHQSHSTHMNFCKTWDLRHYVEGGKVRLREDHQRVAGFPSRQGEGVSSVLLPICNPFPHLTDTPVFEIRTGNCLLKTTSSSAYVVLGRVLQENYKKKGGNYHVALLVCSHYCWRPPPLSLAHFNHVFKVSLTSATSNGRLAYVKRGRDGD